MSIDWDRAPDYDLIDDALTVTEPERNRRRSDAGPGPGHGHRVLPTAAGAEPCSEPLVTGTPQRTPIAYACSMMRCDFAASRGLIQNGCGSSNRS